MMTQLDILNVLTKSPLYKYRPLTASKIGTFLFCDNISTYPLVSAIYAILSLEIRKLKIMMIII